MGRQKIEFARSLFLVQLVLYGIVYIIYLIAGLIEHSLSFFVAISGLVTLLMCYGLFSLADGVLDNQGVITKVVQAHPTYAPQPVKKTDRVLSDNDELERLYKEQNE